MSPKLNNEEINDALDDEDQGTEIELEIDDDEEINASKMGASDNPNVADQLTKTVEQRYNEIIESDAELKEYTSKKVEKRIGKLTYDVRENERQMNEAITYAQGIQKENAELKSRLQKQDGAFISEHMTRLTREMEQAKGDFQTAYQLNDPQAMGEANAAMAKLGAQLASAESTEHRFKRKAEEAPDPVATEPYRPAPSTTANRPPPAIDPKAEEWAERNTWFGQNEELTKGALTIHRQLVTQDGYLPQTDAYYAELDNRLRRNYPNDAQINQGTTEVDLDKPSLVRNSSGTVTPVPSGQGMRKTRNSNKVKLSPSQVAVAKKLGVPLAEYAKSLLAMDNS